MACGVLTLTELTTWPPNLASKFCFFEDEPLSLLFVVFDERGTRGRGPGLTIGENDLCDLEIVPSCCFRFAS